MSDYYKNHAPINAFLLLKLKDINECTEGIDSCAQTCTDTDGSYNCSCDVGYYLANDTYGCDGELKEGYIFQELIKFVFLFKYIQTLMTVQLVSISVLIVAQIPMDHTRVAVTPAINLIKMDCSVMVSC